MHTTTLTLSKVPLFLIFVGGIRGVRYIILEVLVNPIISDSFGFSVEETAYVFTLIAFTPIPGLALLYDII